MYFKNTHTNYLLITKEIQLEISGSNFLAEKMQELHQMIKKVRLWIHLLSANCNSYNLSAILCTKLLSTDALKLCGQLRQNLLGGYPQLRK